MVLLDSEYIHQTILPFLLDKCLHHDVATRHGAILGVAEIIEGLAGSSHDCDVLKSSSGLLEKLVNLVPEIERRRLYRGRSGELVREGVCKLVRSIAMVKVPLSVKEQVHFLDAVETNIPHPSEEIQRCACQSINALLTTYFPVGPNGPTERLQSRVVNKFVKIASTSDNPAATRGYTLALGYLPPKLLAPTSYTLTKVVHCLQKLADPKAKVGGEGDAETRRNSLASIGRIVDIIGFGNPLSSQSLVCFRAELVDVVLDTYLDALSDYNTDRRGDVGSWCRMEAMSCATKTLKKLASCQATMIPTQKTYGIVCGALRQIAEKLDSVRIHCSKCLEELLLHFNLAISQRDAILKSPIRSTLNQHWSQAIRSYPEIVKLAKFPEYTQCVVFGLASSIGGVGVTQSKASWEALLQWIRVQETPTVERCAYCLLIILKESQHRLFIPALVTMDRLLSHRCLNDVIETTDFAAECEPLLTSASCNTTHVARIMAAVDAIVSLAAVVNGRRRIRVCCNLLLGRMCSLLVHRIPRIRTYSAEAFYLLLLDLGRVEAAEAILGTSWITAQPDQAKLIAASLEVTFFKCDSCA